MKLAEDIKARLRQEVILWSQYFVISLVAAVWAIDRYISASVGNAEGADINALGMIRVMWHTYLLPFLCAFVALSLLRFLFLFFSVRSGRKRATGRANAL